MHGINIPQQDFALKTHNTKNDPRNNISSGILSMTVSLIYLVHCIWILIASLLGSKFSLETILHV